jgi:hypothetical protein
MNNIFDWTKEINLIKSPISKFSEDDWNKHFNSYLIHRFLSMNPDNIELVNEIQIVPPSEKKYVYSIYKEYIPKNNKWSKYIKTTQKEPNKDLILYLKNHFEVSSREIKDYLEILDKKQIENILLKQGLENKEIKQLLK